MIVTEISMYCVILKVKFAIYTNNSKFYTITASTRHMTPYIVVVHP